MTDVVARHAELLAADLLEACGERDRARSVAVQLEQQVAAVLAIHEKYTDGDSVFCLACSTIGWPCRTAAALGLAE